MPETGKGRPWRGKVPKFIFHFLAVPAGSHELFILRTVLGFLRWRDPRRASPSASVLRLFRREQLPSPVSPTHTSARSFMAGSREWGEAGGGRGQAGHLPRQNPARFPGSLEEREAAPRPCSGSSFTTGFGAVHAVPTGLQGRAGTCPQELPGPCPPAPSPASCSGSHLC